MMIRKELKLQKLLMIILKGINNLVIVPRFILKRISSLHFPQLDKSICKKEKVNNAVCSTFSNAVDFDVGKGEKV